MYFRGVRGKTRMPSLRSNSVSDALFAPERIVGGDTADQLA